MFRQVLLSSAKKTPSYPASSSTVHKEGTSRYNVDPTNVLVDKESWRRTARDSSFRSLTELDNLDSRDETPSRRWKALFGQMKPRPHSAKVPTAATDQEPKRQTSAAELRTVEAKDEPIVPAITIESDATADVPLPKSSAIIRERLQHLAQSFHSRTQSVKTYISRPRSPTPPPEITRERLDSSLLDLKEDWMVERQKPPLKKQVVKNLSGALNPQSFFYISWLFLVSCGFLYNAWSIFLRAVRFPYQKSSAWAVIDYTCDAIYLLDMLYFSSRVQYIEDGQLVEELGRTSRNYIKSTAFKLDLLSLTPLDLFYYKAVGPNALLRFPRLLKIHCFWQFFDRIDAAAKSPYLIRIVRMLIYMMWLVHVNACAYYAISVWEGLGSNDWVYNNKGNAYLRCFYFAIRTATSISGKMPKPTNSHEYLFMTLSWLLGVFVFAFLIGQIRDIVATATQNQTLYRHITDSTIRYMESMELPERLQTKVRLWLSHTWQQQHTFEEEKILNVLPNKMRTDIAISVHYEMLKKVELFRECERTVIRDLVVKLKPVLFLPNDFICQKGEIGQEMYIIDKGQVCVKEGDKVLATLSEGSVFGEISVLGIPDLWETLSNYPEAQTLLRQKAKRVMRERALEKEHKDEIEVASIIHAGERPETPKLLKAVVAAMPGASFSRKLSNRSSSISVNMSTSATDEEPDTEVNQEILNEIISCS